MCEAKKRALALGYFDGLHIAHTAVLKEAAAQKARGLAPAVLLFDVHPAEALSGARVPRLLTEADRDALLSNMGFELIKIPFAEIRSLSPAAFVRDILKDKMNCCFVSCGYNYTFGKGGAGTQQTLTSLCAPLGIETAVCGQVCVGDTPVSSSAVRQAVAQGDMDLAVKMLGRPFTFAAPVFTGDRRGRLLGAPTANQVIPPELVTPAFGVYAALAEIGGVRYAAVTNVGVRPTFGVSTLRSETHILGFQGDLYGKTLRVGLLSFLRPEQKFGSFEALKRQIAADAATAEDIARKSVYFEK